MSTPSFSSFPPSFSSFPDLEPGPSKRSSIPSKSQDEEPRKHSKHKNKDKKEKRDRKEKKERKGSGDVKSDRKSSEYLEDRPRNEKAQIDYGIDYNPIDPTSRPLFYADRKGDALNIRYGGLHAGDVPRYNTVGRGRKILGLPAFTVVHRGQHNVEVSVTGRRKLPGLTDPSSRHLLAAPPTRRLVISAKDKYKYQEVEGFLRITSHQPKKNENVAYRSITDSKDADSDETDTSEDENGESSAEESDTTPVTSLQATLKSLEEQLTENPTSVPTWLSLLSHTLSTIPVTSKNASKARAEISLSVLSRALSAHSSNSQSKRLRIKYIKAGEEIWDDKKLLSEWEDALKIGGTEIWMEWLDWSVRKADKGLDGIIESSQRVFSSLNGSEIGKLRVFWRAAIAFRDAGYVERAMAMFQAQAELAYHKPSRLCAAPFEIQLDQLEEFWESENLRMGEQGATGWTVWDASLRPEYIPQSSIGKAPQKSNLTDPYSRWAADEASMDRAHWIPSRSTDEDDEADPYATILFSDIRPLLLPLYSPHARQTFRFIWLSFLGLHIPGFSASLSQTPTDCYDDRWSCTCFASPAHLSSIFPENTKVSRITADSQAGVLVGREREYSSPFGPVKNWQYEVLRPLDEVGSNHWSMWSKEDVQDVDESIVREVFGQCRGDKDDVEWEMLNLAFEATVSAKTAAKISKSFLATARDSLPHWAAHARIERRRGRLDEARKVYQTVLSTATSDRPWQSILWWDWAEMEWVSGNSDAALQVVFQSAGIQGSGGVAILRAKRQLDSCINVMSLTRWKDREGWVKLRVLLELLTSTPTAALTQVDAHLSALDVGCAAHESLAVASLVILYTHSSVLRIPTPPTLLRERVEKAFEIYPSNTVLLGLFLEAEKGQGVWGGLKGMLGESTTDNLTKEKDVARRVAEVWVAKWEKGRWEAEQERTRSGLSSAVQDARTRGSTTLWRIYIEFEVRCGQLERAKKLLFRAVGECPLVKELYLLAFGPLRSVFSGRELNDWAETMAERGIRMRRDLEEALEGHRESMATGGMEEGDEAMEDEIEYNAKELRRLRPY